MKKKALVYFCAEGNTPYVFQELSGENLSIEVANDVIYLVDNSINKNLFVGNSYQYSILLLD